MSHKADKYPALITALLDPACYRHKVDKCSLIETHISWVILTGTYVYKIKKPVDFGFLDFSTLEKRQYNCQEELRLNRRLAPDIYLAVVPITGTEKMPDVDGDGNAIEYAVKMIAFEQQSQLDHVLARGELRNYHIDAIAGLVANFHQQVSIADNAYAHGDPRQLIEPVRQNFAQIRENIRNQEHLKHLTELEQWSERTFRDLQHVFKQRKSTGYIRECHGDMHLRNLAWHHKAPLIFDCIEFSPALRWIDVISDIAFLIMDLQDRQQSRLAQRFLNEYLEASGDYGGVRVLRFYLMYRALVRAKVDAIRAVQKGLGKQEIHDIEKDFFSYIKLAQSYAQACKPVIIITHGPSASGKSTYTQSFLERIGAIRTRSDVERKRLAGFTAERLRGTEGVGTGIYNAKMTQLTYDKLLEHATHILDGGYPVIVDAVFLKYEQRIPFQQLAQEKRVKYIILELTASTDTLRRRITSRTRDVSDANLKVLDYQLKHWEPLRINEQQHVIPIDTEIPLSPDALESLYYTFINNDDEIRPALLR